MRREIISAIQGHREITFTYDGFARVAQPCAVGISHTGNEVLRCYQVGGGHVTPDHKWNLCKLSKIQNLIVTDTTFQGEPQGYKRGDRSMTQIYAEL